MSYHCLGFVTVFNRAQLRPKNREKVSQRLQTATRCYQMFRNWARYSRRTWEINPPTCILTAIDSEFSSLSSSLRTTSFFSVRLQSLWRGERTRDGERKRNRLVAWLTHCEHTFMTHCCIWGREAWQKNQHLQLPQFISTCVFILSLVCTPPGIINYCQNCEWTIEIATQ